MDTDTIQIKKNVIPINSDVVTNLHLSLIIWVEIQGSIYISISQNLASKMSKKKQHLYA